MFTQNCNFLFVPVDKDFKSRIDDLSTSRTPFPSETDLNGVTGFLLIPAFVDTKEILFSPWMKNHESPNIKGYYLITADPYKDGLIMMNWDPSKKQVHPPGVNVVGTVQYKATATVPGFQQNYAVYLLTGTAFIIEKYLKAMDWEEVYVKDTDDLIERKLSNAFPENKTIAHKSWDGLSAISEVLKKIFGVAGPKMGFKISGESKEVTESNIFELMSEEFYANQNLFKSLTFDNEVIEFLKVRAEKAGQEEFFSYLSSL